MKIEMNVNGNKVVKIERQDFGVGRGFSIQTNGNLPFTHMFSVGSLDNVSAVEKEIINQEIMMFVLEFGSEAQENKVLGASQE